MSNDIIYISNIKNIIEVSITKRLRECKINVNWVLYERHQICESMGFTNYYVILGVNKFLIYNRNYITQPFRNKIKY